MKILREFGIWIFLFWTIGPLPAQETEEDYLDPESMPVEYFQLENGKPMHLNETDHCLQEISATVISAALYGNHTKSLYYIKIRWISKNFMMSIKVESNSLNDSYCEAENKHYYNRKPLNQTVHVFPDDVNEGIRFLPIKLDCKYTITPELEGMCRPMKFEYATPVCIDNVTCSCRNVFLPGPILRVDLEKDGINVLWSFPKTANGTASKIVILIYQEDGINIKKIAKRKAITESLNWSKGSIKHKVYFRMSNLTNENNYRIQSYFENSIACHGNSTFLRFRHPGSMEHGSNPTILPSTITFTFLVVCVLGSFLLLWRKHLKRICRKVIRAESLEVANVEFFTENYHQKGFLLPPMVSNTSYLDQSSDIQDSYWFDYRDLVIIKEIGNGNFGVVFLATSSKNLKGSHEFAVKQLKDKAGPEDLADFIEEINTFKLVGSHPNVVKMFGYCGAPYPLSIIMEYVPFNLLKYLRNLRIKFERRKTRTDNFINYAELSHSRSCSTIDYDYISQSDVESGPHNSQAKEAKEMDYVLDNRDLEVFGLQIARGMSHLESRAIIHRDLAARNVLMDAFKNLKISDFGMSRTGIYVNKTTRKFPLRWMSPEALVNRTYSNKSDVWSFGVVLWEIGTLGAFPYSGLQNEEVISFLKKGGHLEKPENVTDHLYDVMVECWTHLPDERPTFRELVHKLEESCRADHGYVDFGCLKSNYVFPPMEEDVDPKKSGPE